jgi:hypothetical protein
MRRPHFVPTELPQTEILLERRPMIDSLVFTLPFALLDQSEMIVADTSPYNSRRALWVAAPYGDYFHTDPEAYYAINSFRQPRRPQYQSQSKLIALELHETCDRAEVTKLMLGTRILKMTASRLPIIGRKNIKFTHEPCLIKHLYSFARPLNHHFYLSQVRPSLLPDGTIDVYGENSYAFIYTVST